MEENLLNNKTTYAEVVYGEYYGYVISLLEEQDRGDLGVWYYTEDLPNEYTGYYQMWFKQEHLNFDIEI